jgi:ParB family transcriptional regulator, chromosome partitioning protein
LIEQFQLTQEEAAVRVGKGRVVVANALRLLKLASEVQAFVREGRLSVGHAKAILGLAAHFRSTIGGRSGPATGRMTVRQTEEMVAGWQTVAGEPASRHGGRAQGGDPNLRRIQDRIRERVGTKVQLRYRQGKGSIQIQFFSDDDLERVLDLLGVSAE